MPHPSSWDVCFATHFANHLHSTQDNEIQINARKEAYLENDTTGAWLELDIWLPQLRLAFEYQVSVAHQAFFFSLNGL
jgi:hypothetical protein